MNILIAVARHGRVRPAEICRLLRMEKSTLSRDVEIMKSRDSLESDPPTGGRNQVLRVIAERPGPARQVPARLGVAESQASLLIGDAGVDTLRRIAAKLGFGATAD